MSASLLLAGAFGLQAVGTFVSSNSEAQAIRAQSKYQAQQLDFNSRVAELQAKDATSRGESQANEQQTKTRLLIGKQRAAMAAQGIEINSDSALFLQMDTAELGALDVLTIRNNAFREATGYRIDAINSTGQAEFARISGRSASRTTLLTGGLTALSQGLRGASAFSGGLKTEDYSDLNPTGF